jgi:hypothetical protein
MDMSGDGFQLRNGPFNLIPNVAEKNILILMEENKNLIHSFCHIT